MKCSYFSTCFTTKVLLGGHMHRFSSLLNLLHYSIILMSIKKICKALYVSDRKCLHNVSLKMNCVRYTAIPLKSR